MLPLLAGLMLCGCDPNANTGDEFDDIGGGGTVEVADSADTLAFTEGYSLSGSALAAVYPAGSGYANSAGTKKIGNYNVVTEGFQVNDDPGDVNGNTINVFQLCKAGDSRCTAGGSITVKNIKAGRVRARVLVKSNYSWGSNQIGTVTFGGNAVTVPSSSTSEVSQYSTDWKVHTVELNTNSTTTADFKVHNTGNKFVFYIIQLDFYGC